MSIPGSHGFVSGLAYCGNPPAPAEMWFRWNLDPVLLAVLAIVAGLYGLGARRANVGRSERAAFWGGWLILSLALVSPLCALSVSLFSARVGQHMLLSLIAIPLLAFGRAVPAIARVFTRGRLPTAPPLAAALLFAVLIWVWHSPYAYDATFDGDLVYWLMHVSVIGAAMLLWSALIDRETGRVAGVIGAGLFSTVQMGLLGAIVTFAPQPLFAAHLLTAGAWGLTPLQDQQLGGAIMWVPGCLVFLSSAMVTLWRILADSSQRGQGAAGIA